MATATAGGGPLVTSSAEETRGGITLRIIRECEWRALIARCESMGIREHLRRASWITIIRETWYIDGYEECEWARIQLGHRKPRPANEIQPYPIGRTTNGVPLDHVWYAGGPL